MKTKTCFICQTVKSTSEFNQNKARKDGLQTRCRACQQSQAREYYRTHKDPKYFRAKNQRNEKIKRQFIYDYLKVNPCIDCGEGDPVVLEFDHLRDKEFNLADARGFSIERIQKEIEKCDVVCRNCHTRRTAKQFAWYADLQ